MPTVKLDTKDIKDAVQAACRAPSLHNIQPWRWVVEHDELQLFLDPARVLPSDRVGREAVIGCGAALDHLRSAMSAAGLHANVQRFPNPNDRDHLASIHFARMAYITDGHRRRADAIWVRRSDRLPLDPPAHWDSFEPVLRNRLHGYEVQLDVLPQDAHPRLTQAAHFTESLRLYDSAYHAELSRWTVPFEESAGIPYSALTSATESGRVDIGRDFPVVGHRDRRTQILEDQSTILVLSTNSDSRADALAAGEALSAILLECTLAGYATCPLTHLTEVQAARQIVAALVDRDAKPQVLIRVGHAPATEETPPRTRRRPLADVLVVHDS